jgi:hypothetical protein
MRPEFLTLAAAAIAAVTSLASLILNTKLTLSREKRSLLWQKELKRLTELEEKAGEAHEIAMSFSGQEVREREFVPLHNWLRHAAGRFSRYPDLSKAIRELNHSCALVTATNFGHKKSFEWRDEIPKHFHAVIRECDRITERRT